MDPNKEKDHLAAETDGSFFEDMRQMERDILTRNGDTEGLAALDALAEAAAAEAEEADRLDAEGAFDPK